MIFGLGGTTPLPRWLLGRAYEILTFERFTFWATLMAMPIVGLLSIQLLDRFRPKLPWVCPGSRGHDRCSPWWLNAIPIARGDYQRASRRGIS